MKKINFLTLLSFFLLIAACSGGNNGSNSSATLAPAAPANTTTEVPNILTATLEDKRAMMVAVNQVLGNTSQVSSPTPAATTLKLKNEIRAFSLVSNVYADTVSSIIPVCPTNPEGLACPEGGCLFFETPTGDAGTVTPGAEGSGILNFNNFATQVRTEQCKGRPIESCRFPYSTTGSGVAILNGTMTFPSGGGEPVFNITGRASTSGECSGMTVDTSNDFNRPRSMGFRTQATITGPASTAIRNANITGEICIDQIHYPIPSREQLNQLIRDLCGS